MDTTRPARVIEQRDLVDGAEFEGRRWETGTSFILVDMAPGGAVALHRHAYGEIFIVQEGSATYRAGEATLRIEAPRVVIVPAGVAHGFANTGSDRLRQVDIHLSPTILTEWLDEAAAVPPEAQGRPILVEKGELLEGSRFQGHLYPDVNASFIWGETPPGGGVRLHRHPYDEVQVVQEGSATYRIGAGTLQVEAPRTLVIPAGTAHAFTATGERPYRMVAIHVSDRFDRELL
jgi:quercetin dioxygenase-like cupin family protein